MPRTLQPERGSPEERASAIKMRAVSPIAYAQGVRLWEASDGQQGILPISPELDHDLRLLRIAEVLQRPVTELADIPQHWIDAAMVAIELRRVGAEQG